MSQLSDGRLTALAGAAVFKRGLDYRRQGRVRLLKQTDSDLEAEVSGTEPYRLQLQRQGDRLSGWCACPADGFCKHLVAAALTWRDGDAVPQAAGPGDDLLKLLRAQQAETLARWLHEIALEDPQVGKRLRLLVAKDDVGEFGKSLADMLKVSGFLDWRRSNEYAKRLAMPLQLLAERLDDDPLQCFSLCGATLERLLKIYSRSDDSGGALRDRIHQFADLHRRAAAAACAGLDAKAFARNLLRWQKMDEWVFFAAASYWQALGEDGRDCYAALVEAEFAKLPASRGGRGTEAWLKEFGPVHRMEELALLRRDFDSLLRVLTRDLSSGHAYVRLVEVSREFGRERDALQWAERGVKAHPDWPSLRSLLAEELLRAGLNEEAVAVLWRDFQRHPMIEAWQRLKNATGAEWPAYRQRALDHVQSKERAVTDGLKDASPRLNLLLADGDIAGARVLVTSTVARPALLHDLASRLEPDHPVEAASLLRRIVDAELPAASEARSYARQVELIAAVVRLVPGPDVRAWVGELKLRYRARRKLLELLAARGL